jgi:hypothetical protein
MINMNNFDLRSSYYLNFDCYFYNLTDLKDLYEERASLRNCLFQEAQIVKD